MGLERRKELYRKCHERLLKTLRENDMEHLADTVMGVVPSPITMRENKPSSSSWSMKKMSIVRRLLGDRKRRGQMFEEEEEEQYGPETTTQPPSLSSKAKLAQALMRIGLSSPNSAGLKEVWNAEKRKDFVSRRMRWKKSSNNQNE